MGIIGGVIVAVLLVYLVGVLFYSLRPSQAIWDDKPQPVAQQVDHSNGYGFDPANYGTTTTGRHDSSQMPAYEAAQTAAAREKMNKPCAASGLWDGVWTCPPRRKQEPSKAEREATAASARAEKEARAASAKAEREAAEASARARREWDAQKNQPPPDYEQQRRDYKRRQAEETRRAEEEARRSRKESSKSRMSWNIHEQASKAAAERAEANFAEFQRKWAGKDPSKIRREGQKKYHPDRHRGESPEYYQRMSANINAWVDSLEKGGR